jgi:tetratricopeptide (TPR) repeat protein
LAGDLKTYNWRRGPFIIAGLVYLAAHLIAGLTGSPYWWGVDSWRMFPPSATWVLFGLGVLLFVPQVQRAVLSQVKQAGRIIICIPRPVWVIGAGAVFWLFRQRTFFLGDGFLRIRNVTDHLAHGFRFPLMTWEEPLDTFVHSALYLLSGHFAFITGRFVYQGVSIAAGITALWLVTGYVRTVYRTSQTRTLAIIAVFTTGAVQLFFGYVESYTVAWMCVLAALMALLAMLKSGAFSVVPAILFAFAVSSHPLTLAIAPGIAYGYWCVIGSESGRNKNGLWGLVLVVIALIWAVTAVMLHFGVASTGQRLSAGVSHFLPLFPGAGNGGYAVFSWAHAVDIANELALLLPLGIALVLPVMASDDIKAGLRNRLLLLAAAGPLCMLVFLDPKLGSARDWDLFSLLALPATLLIAERLTRLQKQDMHRIIVPLIGVAFLHTVPWILVNSSETASLDRFNRLAGTPWWSETSKGIAYEALGTYESEHARYGAAADAYAVAYEHTGNIRYYRNVIAMYQKGDDPDGLGRFVQSQKPLAEGFAYLGELYLRLKRVEEASVALRQAVALDPQYPNAYFNLGNALSTAKQYAESLDAFTHALTLASDPSSRAMTLTNRANAYLLLGQLDNAVADYLAAIESLPSYNLAHYNLAYAYYLRNEFDLAGAQLDEAARTGYPKAEVEQLRGMIGEQKSARSQ